MAHLVWLKRDLRLDDHAPLRAACAAGPTVVLWVTEPALWQRPERDASHLVFASQCLAEVADGLRARGHRLVCRVGRMRDVLADLHHTLGLDAVWSYEESGDGWTYGRDRAVAAWLAARGIPWHEAPRDGVQRRHPGRDGWARRRDAQLAAPPADAPARIPAPAWPDGFDFGALPTPQDAGLPPSTKAEAWHGGSSHARELLSSFLTERGAHYATALSSPVSGEDGCSRLAPHLTWGSLSMRRVVHATRARQEQVALGIRHGAPDLDPVWARSLDAFQGRLAWRDHFVQKLEDQPSIEFRNAHRGYDGLRAEDPSRWSDHQHAKLRAWITGRTGWPMVDAVMRQLHAGGWTTFRMRAMLASVATHLYWLHWRPAQQALAPHFLDHEPGIHISQFQMQAGTFGINTLRVYSPTKQARDHDPSGAFIRRWVPELTHVPDEHVHTPWTFRGDLDYPSPLVDEHAAARAVHARFEAWRRRKGMAETSGRVHRRHGSRKGGWRSRRRR